MSINKNMNFRGLTFHYKVINEVKRQRQDKSNKEKVETNKLLELKSEDIIDEVCNEMIIGTSNNNIEVIKI